MKTKILLLDTGKEWGGGTNSMIELLKRIDRTRFEVVAMFYRDYPKGQSSSLSRELAMIGVPLEILPPEKQPLWAKLAKELVKGIWRRFPLKRSRLVFAIERRWRITPTARRISSRLRAGGFDLLYMNNQPSSNLEGYLAAEMAAIPVVQHCRIEVSLQAVEVAIVNRAAHKVICVSEGVRASLVERGVRPELCEVVYNAIDSRQEIPRPVSLASVAQETLLIGSIGSLIKRKANDHLLRAAAILRAEGISALQLILVGEGPELVHLRQLATELGLSKHIVFAGFQQHPLAWAAAMDIVVLASAKEGLPRVLLEAMLLEKPVIASDVVGSRELVNDGITGKLYPFGDINSLAKSLRELIESRDLRLKMGRAGKIKVVASFSIDTYVAGVQRILSEAAT
ncbi:glycosyltransferase [Rhodocyclus tenuis]|uniref:Glycosyltransferase n=1 Tax=Rhodocyclus gracilis TaxID=2929842 RepID=A0ABX0WN34_9RHOO|nr:glycosyltransferase [Rhodocyclus gracilis]NJA89985.1 glycosyltransferase [Rhodocyclus gracilis]